MPMTGQQTLECINDDRVSTVPNHVLMATEGSSSAGYTAVAEAVHRHWATSCARLCRPALRDAQRGMAPRAVPPSDAPQGRFKDVPEALSTAATNAQSRSSARYC